LEPPRKDGEQGGEQGRPDSTAQQEVEPTAAASGQGGRKRRAKTTGERKTSARKGEK